jgi:hypothetical protein
MHPSYARSQPTSRPELYEFSLVKGVNRGGECRNQRLTDVNNAG